jgi:hypothetical protein
MRVEDGRILGPNGAGDPVLKLLDLATGEQEGVLETAKLFFNTFRFNGIVRGHELLLAMPGETGAP